MRLWLPLVAVVFAAGTASASQPNASDHGKDAAARATTNAPRHLYVCERDQMTARGFSREFGAAEFVTAQEALERGGDWRTPKCISALEARRLQKQLARAP